MKKIVLLFALAIAFLFTACKGSMSYRKNDGFGNNAVKTQSILTAEQEVN